MSYTTTKHIVRVIGKIWMPSQICAMEYTLTDFDLKQYHISRTRPTREQIQNWINTNTGDFQSIIDFYANIGDNHEIPWSSEESEYTYMDCTTEPEIDIQTPEIYPE